MIKGKIEFVVFTEAKWNRGVGRYNILLRDRNESYNVSFDFCHMMAFSKSSSCRVVPREVQVNWANGRI